MSEYKDGEKDILSPVVRDGVVKEIGVIVGVVLSVVVFLYIARFWGGSLGALSGDPANWGAFGDYFAGIMNPIVAILTLILVAATVYYTKEMLNTTKEEMRNAQKEMAQQNFDSQMFFLLKLLREVRSDIGGANAIESAFHSLIGYVSGNSHESTGYEDIKRRCLIPFENQFKHSVELQPYFTTFVSTLSLMNEVAETAKVGNWDNYKNMISGFLTEDEIIVLTIYTWSPNLTNRGAGEQRLADFLKNYTEWHLQGLAARSLLNLRHTIWNSDKTVL